MKKIFLYSSLLCLWVNTMVNAQNTIEKEVIELHLVKFDWMKTGQISKLENLLHADVLYIHSNGWTEQKNEVLQNIESGKLKYSSVKVEESRARQFAETVIVTGKGLFNVELDGNPLEILLLYTEVYQILDGRWQLLSRHALRL
jgi:hypothetical protein